MEYSMYSTTPSSTSWSSSNPPHPSPSDANAVKERIMVHPHYPRLVAAHADFKLLGAPTEVAARLSAVFCDILNHPGGRNFPTADPELDHFMEVYCGILVKYREEIARPVKEAAEFLREAESQLSCIVGGRSICSFSSTADDEKCGAAYSDSQEGLLLDSNSAGETVMEDKIWAEDRELKNQLLRKYNGYIGTLRRELSKKRKMGKLPKEARQKLLGWWEFHNKWPYPSESEKKALAESTGLDQKQINNWFINQRKRHWKPSEEMQFMVFDGYQQQQQDSSSFYMEGCFMGDGSMYRIGP